MPDPVAQALRAAARRQWLAETAILWERLWPALWPAAFVAGLFVCATLFGFWETMPAIGHLAILLLFLAAFVAELIRGFRDFRLPKPADGMRRLERASGLEHRPLSALADRLDFSGEDDGTRGLWLAHREQMARKAQNLRVGFASPGMARHDPLGLRAALILTLVVAVGVGANDAQERFAHAVTPEVKLFPAASPIELSVSLTPPTYTGQAPIFWTSVVPTIESEGTGGAASPTRVPAQSALVARVHGGEGVPRLVLGEQTHDFTAIDAANYEIDTRVEEGNRISVTQDGETLGSWPITVVPDLPPSVASTKPPGATNRWALRLDYAAEDDYGVSQGHATLALVNRPAETLEIALNLSRIGAKSLQGTSFHDLTPHPWAGLPVVLRLEVGDAAGQWGRSEPVELELPARPFTHPVARAIADERRRLALDPSARPDVAEALDEISRRPDEFGEDVGVFLTLRVALAQLMRHGDEATIAQVQDLLWQVALAIEEGPLALAEQALRDAMQALMEALGDENVGDADLEQQIEELRRTLDEFLIALADQALQQPGMNPPQAGQYAERDDLHEMLDQAQDLARTGSREAAQELLSQLQEFLESLQGGRLAGISQDGSLERNMEALENLEDLIGQQEQLLDQTFRQGQRHGGGMGSGVQFGGRGARPGGTEKSSANQQEALRQALRDLMLDMADGGLPVPRELGQAEKSMGRAGRALNQDQPRRATRPQTQAIDQMQQAAQGMLDSMMPALGDSASGTPVTSGPFSAPRDPFGRRLGQDATDDGTIRITTRTSSTGSNMCTTSPATKTAAGRTYAICREISPV